MSRRCGSTIPTPTPLNVLAMKPGKTRRKIFEGNTIIRQSIVKNLPRTASVVGGAIQRRRYDKAPTVKNLPRTGGVAGGGDTKKDELKENESAMTRETDVKTSPQATIVAGGERKRRKPTRNGKVAQLTDPRGRKVPR